MTHTVVGLFDNRSEAQAAMQELVRHGFIQDDIDLSNRSYAEGDYAAGSTATASTGGGTEAGNSISNFFNSLFGGDNTTASAYANVAQDADAILTVQVDSEERARQAAEILDRNGAIDVDGRYADYSQGAYPGAAETTGATYMDNRTDVANTTTNVDNTTNLEDRASIPVMEEQLQVGKREVERGGARIRSRIVERPVEANVRLRQEHVVVRRRPVDRAVTQADMDNFREGEIELTERAEVPVVGKQARVVEEIEVGKQVQEREETVRDTVRRTEVDVQETSGDVTDATDDIGHTGSRRATS
jgi:uncharacterized protein (TIGR02271 family)